MIAVGSTLENLKSDHDSPAGIQTDMPLAGFIAIHHFIVTRAKKQIKQFAEHYAQYFGDPSRYIAQSCPLKLHYASFAADTSPSCPKKLHFVSFASHNMYAPQRNVATTLKRKHVDIL